MFTGKNMDYFNLNDRIIKTIDHIIFFRNTPVAYVNTEHGLHPLILALVPYKKNSPEFCFYRWPSDLERELLIEIDPVILARKRKYTFEEALWRKGV